jgi:hypothetical protein
MARLTTMLGMTAAIGVGTLVIDSGALPIPFGLAGPSCSIKGNVSPNTGERIYHVPGQDYYYVTKIDRLGGERWFCSESEARQAGWRRSKV